MPSRRLLLPIALGAAGYLNAQQPSYTSVPLKDCDRLLLAPVEIDGRRYDFLVDTGATTILNDQTFRGDARTVVINSFRGEAATKGSMVRVKELALGNSRLRDLTLKAIDLSALDSACNQRIDGLLGVDTLAKLQASIDVKKRVAKVATATESKEYAALVQRMLQCNDLFNQGDTDHFRQQFAPDVVWVAHGREIRGREEVIRHIREDYARPGAKMIAHVEPSDFHLDGDTYWVNFISEVVLPERTLRFRSTMISTLKDSKWQVQTAHFTPIAQ
jgi:hypothetical protein